jgi:tRNA-splicing ligase RtcB
VLARLGVPEHWSERTEQARYRYGTDHISRGSLSERLGQLDQHVRAKLAQIGSLGSGNHFSECQRVTVSPGMESIAAHFGIQSGKVGFLSHCGSRGFGFQLAAAHFKGLERHFAKWGIPLPAGERELVYAPADSPEGRAYLLDMYLGANFATVNHLLINSYVLEAFQEVIPGTKGDLVYHISHNIGREEIVGGNKRWVFRKGATRAFPAGHHALKGTAYESTGHPILLPGNPESGSYIMVGAKGAEKTACSINHGAGRAMGRNAARRALNQADVDAKLLAADIIHNGRQYPLDEAPAAYKDFAQVTKSVEQAGLARVVAKLSARFVIKDNEGTAEGSA